MNLRGRNKVSPEFSMSSMTDIVFLLLVFFLLTSSLAPLINLSYGKMVKMALPYTIVLGGVGLLGVYMVL